ncbi:MAG: beta-aspartyl-peptidase [Schleiferiaceae bacterium]|nr:beta-aspartyl-peptidase [Schleiferiaceae bacterium]
MRLLKNFHVFAPKDLGFVDILVAHGKVLCVEENLNITGIPNLEVVDGEGAIITPGFIDQHIHLIGAGGKRGFSSLTRELEITDLWRVGTTTAVGLLGTDGATRNPKSLYSKVKAFDEQGLSAFMHTGYYGLDPCFITDSAQNDLIFIDKVIGSKVAISDIRSSFPTDNELLKRWREVYVGGMVSGKKGVLHVHLGPAKEHLDPLFRMVKDFDVPISSLSPTHVARSKELFEEAILFAKLGGSIDITTGASKFTEPHLAVYCAVEEGVPITQITFSTDGNAGLDAKDVHGNVIGTKSAPIEANLSSIRALLTDRIIETEQALSLVTVNVANHLNLKGKGRVSNGYDADFCVFDDQWNLKDVYTKGISRWM